MGRCRICPRPAAELGALVVGDGLAYLGLGVHDKRAVLCHGFSDGFALQQQKLSFFAAIDNLDGRIGLQLHRAVAANTVPANRHRLAFEKVQQAPRPGLGRWQGKACAGLHAQRPDGDVGLGLGRP